MTWREKVAGKFGKSEHEAGRWILLPMAVTVLLIYLQIYDYALYASIVTFIVWLIYLISHRLEKFFYGKGLRR